MARVKPTFKEISHGSQEWADAVRLREKILREPLGARFTEKELEEEKDHFQIAGFLDDALIASAVLVPEGNKMKMQRVVVLENLRNLDIGSEMMTFCEEFSSDRNFNVIYCHARNTAVNFYVKNGYSGIGDYFDEDGIPHLKMRKEVSSRGHGLSLFVCILFLVTIPACIGFNWGHHFNFTNQLDQPFDSLKISIGEYDNIISTHDSTYSFYGKLDLPMKGKRSPVTILLYSGDSTILLQADSFGAFNADGTHEYILKRPKAEYIFHN